jgi:signal transduction histidine kinase
LNQQQEKYMQQVDDIIAFELWDKTERQIAKFNIEKLPESIQLRVTQNYSEDNFRNIYRRTDFGAVRLVVNVNNPSFQGTRGVTRGCEIYLSLIPKFKQIEDRQRNQYDILLRRFAHNLIKFQTRFKGNFSRLISDAARSRPFKELKDEVKRRIEQDTDRAAEDVCQMSHRAVDLDAQIDTLRIIAGYADSPDSSNKIKVNLQKTIFRLINPFIEELRERGIEIRVVIPQASNHEDKVLADPGLFNAAMWQLLDNASKYVRDNTEILITATIDSTPQKLEILMTSICIDQDEEEAIFLEGKKGRHAGTKGEHGIGLYVVKKSLSLMGAKILVHNEGVEDEYKGFNYCRNRFIIEFSK